MFKGFQTVHISRSHSFYLLASQFHGGSASLLSQLSRFHSPPPPFTFCVHGCKNHSQSGLEGMVGEVESMGDMSAGEYG